MNAIVLMFAGGDPRQYPSIPPATPPSCPCQVVNHLSANEYNAGQLLTLWTIQLGLGYLSIQDPNIQLINVEEILSISSSTS